jgi:hypothetical protein
MNMDYSTARETIEFMVVLSLLNNIKVYVVTHVKVKYRPIVALSDDVVSV